LTQPTGHTIDRVFPLFGYQFVFALEWVKLLGINLKFGVDGISMTLLLLVGN